MKYIFADCAVNGDQIPNTVSTGERTISCHENPRQYTHDNNELDANLLLMWKHILFISRILMTVVFPWCFSSSNFLEHFMMNSKHIFCRFNHIPMTNARAYMTDLEHGWNQRYRESYVQLSNDIVSPAKVECKRGKKCDQDGRIRFFTTYILSRPDRLVNTRNEEALLSMGQPYIFRCCCQRADLCYRRPLSISEYPDSLQLVSKPP